MTSLGTKKDVLKPVANRAARPDEHLGAPGSGADTRECAFSTHRERLCSPWLWVYCNPSSKEGNALRPLINIRTAADNGKSRCFVAHFVARRTPEVR